MRFQGSPRQLLRILAIIIALLTLANLGVQTARFATGNDSLFGLVWLFSLGADGNVPTYYASLALLLCAGLLALIGFGSIGTANGDTGYWLGLAVIFTFLCADEMLMLHEKLIDPVRNLVGAGGLFYYAWVIPYGLAVLVFVAVYLRFLWRLPARTRTLFVVSGTLFIVGAIGFEMLGGRHSELHGNLNVAYVALQTVEELLEMAGIALIAFAIADYIETERGGLRLSLGAA